jgi:hypothetical protein
VQVCVRFLRRLLVQPRQWQLRELMAEWAAAVPAPFMPQPAMLDGEAIADAPAAAGAAAGSAVGGPGAWGGDVRVMPLCAEALPLEPCARFEALFALRPRWEKSEMERFLRGMQVVSGWAARRGCGMGAVEWGACWNAALPCASLHANPTPQGVRSACACCLGCLPVTHSAVQSPAVVAMDGIQPNTT